MSRPFTCAQQFENRAFLAALERTGNIRSAAREIGRGAATMHGRRAACPAFAQRWAAVLAVAQARLAAAAPGQDKALPDATARRTVGGEAVVVRCKDGTVQVRRAQPGKLTRACEQAFLAALSATCNVRLSAAAAGACEAAFYRRRRRDAGFAREMRLALAEGYQRLETALLEAGLVDSHSSDTWRRNDPPAMPALSVHEMFQLLYLHQKEVRLLADPPHFKRRRGETREAQCYRYQVMYELGQQRRREEYEIAEAARRERGERSPFEPAPPELPALDQVTGWSQAASVSPAAAPAARRSPTPPRTGRGGASRR